MGTYDLLKQTIDNNIKTNGRQEITGQVLNTVLVGMVDSLGSGATVAGVALPDTNPGTPDANVCWLAGPGTYANFGGLTVPDNAIGLLYMSGGAWAVKTMSVGSSVYMTNGLLSLTAESDASAVVAAIGSWDAFYAALQSRKVIADYSGDYGLVSFGIAGGCVASNGASVVFLTGNTVRVVGITYTAALPPAEASYAVTVTDTALQPATDDTLHTTDKTVVGAINEVSDALGYKGTVSPIDVPLAQDGYYRNNLGALGSNSNYGIYSPLQIKKGQIIYGNANVVSTGWVISQINNTNWVQGLVVGKVTGAQDIFFIAPYDMTIEICCAKSTFPNLRLATLDSFAALQDNGFALGMRKIYESYGAVYNEETGYYELNGLTDITEEQMFEIIKTYGAFNISAGTSNSSVRLSFSYKSRTFLQGVVFDFIGSYFSLYNTFRSCPNLEVLIVGSSSYPLKATSFNTSCYNLSKLKEIYYIDTTQSTSVVDAFKGCIALQKCLIKIAKSISFPDSPLLSYESLNYLVTNAANTDAITVTVHATTYAYLTGTEQPTPEVGGTTEEWQALVTAAQEKQISFATA